MALSSNGTWSGNTIYITDCIIWTFFSQTGLSEDEWYDSIESAILAITGIFFSPVVSIVDFGLQKNRPWENNICCNCILPFRNPTNLRLFRGNLGILEEPPIGDILSFL